MLHCSEASPLLQRTGKKDFCNRFISKWVWHINLGHTCTIRSHWSFVCSSIFIPYTSVHLLPKPDNPLSLWTVANFSLSYRITISKLMWELIMTHPSPFTWALICTKCNIRTLGCNMLIWAAAWVQMACLKLAPSPDSALWFERKLISSPSSWMLHWPCLVLVGALSAASAEMVGGQPHGGLLEAAWVGLLLLRWVCMECNKQHLSYSHTAASCHISDLFSQKKRKIRRKENSSQQPFRVLFLL